MKSWLALCFILALTLGLFAAESGVHAQVNGWIFPAPLSSTYNATAADNGKGISNLNVLGANLTVNLANPNTLATGYELTFGTDNGKGFFINASGGVFILAGQKTLTSFSVPSNSNYEFITLISDGANYRLKQVSRSTALYNGLIGDAGGENWTFLFSTGYSATQADNGHILSNALTGALTTVTLPSTSLIPTGWSIGLYADNGNPLTVQVNGVSGGQILTLAQETVSSLALSATGARAYANVSFDGSNFRILTALTPGNAIISVPNNTALKALPTSTNVDGVTSVFRAAFGLVSNGGAAQYVWNSASCSLNSGAGDNGAQVKPNGPGTGCYNLLPLPGVYDLRIWGALIDDVTDDSAAEIAANTAITTLYGGGTLLVADTGHCMIGQNFTAGSGPLGAAVIVKGANIAACLKSKPNATGPVFQTPNAYQFMQRKTTAPITQATFTIPVSDTDRVVPGQTIFVIDDTGTSRLGITDSPAVSGSNIMISSWVSGAFTAASGSWWGNLNDVGPPNTGLENITVDGNILNQVPINNNIAAAQTTGGAGNLVLANDGRMLTPYSNQFLEFYSPGNISSVVFTVQCDLVRSDFTTTSQSFTVTGINTGWGQPNQAPCNHVTQIAADRAVTSPITIGTPDGVGAQDCIVHYGPNARYRNVVSQNCRGWPYRFAFIPGTGFFGPAPSGKVYGQEAYLENLQCFISHAGGMWFNGPNDSRTNSFACNFMKGIGLWIDRFSGGAKFDLVHTSGGNTGVPGIGLQEPQIGILSLADSVHCRSCTAEEANENIVIYANNNVFDEFEVFHIDDTSDRIGIKVGAAGSYSAAPVLGTVVEGKCKNLGSGCFLFSSEGGWGSFKATGYVSGVWLGKPAYQGTPSLCTASGSGSAFNINIVGANATSPINPLVKAGPCTSWTPSLKFGGVAPAQTSSGEISGNIAEFRVLINGAPGPGIVTMDSPFGANQTCMVNASSVNAASGLTGAVSGRLQGGSVTFQQSSTNGYTSITETGGFVPFIGGTTIFGTIGPCILP